jgi:hypothetical protein
MRIVLPEGGEEHALYPAYPDDYVPEKPEHEYQVRYLHDAFTAMLPQHRVTGNISMLGWDGRYSIPLVHDVVILDGRAPCDRRDGLAWSERDLLLAIDVSGRGIGEHYDGQQAEEALLCQGALEYCYFDASTGKFQAWRQRDGEVTEVSLSENQRFVSEATGLQLGTDSNRFLRLFGEDGRALLPYEQERGRAETLEQEVERLREELRRRNGSGPSA